MTASDRVEEEIAWRHLMAEWSDRFPLAVYAPLDAVADGITPDARRRILAAVAAAEANEPLAWNLLQEIAQAEHAAAERIIVARQLGVGQSPSKRILDGLLGRPRRARDRLARPDAGPITHRAIIPNTTANLKPSVDAHLLPPKPEAEPLLPGGLTWPQIEETYRALAAKPTGIERRRRIPAEPSRPEVARALLTSVASLKRACKAAGRGTRWPPAGL